MSNNPQDSHQGLSPDDSFDHDAQGQDESSSSHDIKPEISSKTRVKNNPSSSTSSDSTSGSSEEVVDDPNEKKKEEQKKID
jgi:hypothetical protein